MSPSVSKELKKHTQKNITTSFHPVDTNLPTSITQEVAKEKLALDASLEYLLFFGLIRPYKGLDLLIKSLPQLRHNKPNTRLLIVGEPYEPLRKYRELVASLKVDDMVFFHDRFVPTEQIHCGLVPVIGLCNPINQRRKVVLPPWPFTMPNRV